MTAMATEKGEHAGTRPREVWALLAFIIATAAAAALGGLATRDAGQTYQALEQPVWAPPGWVFGPVWTLLYVGIAVSGWLIWRAQKWGPETLLWTVQLGINALWSPIFFAWGLRGLALAWILLLDAMVLVLIMRTWQLRWPAWLLVPYMAWIAFATLLNGAVWWLN